MNNSADTKPAGALIVDEEGVDLAVDEDVMSQIHRDRSHKRGLMGKMKLKVSKNSNQRSTESDQPGKVTQRLSRNSSIPRLSRSNNSLSKDSSSSSDKAILTKFAETVLPSRRGSSESNSELIRAVRISTEPPLPDATTKDYTIMRKVTEAVSYDTEKYENVPPKLSFELTMNKPKSGSKTSLGQEEKHDVKSHPKPALIDGLSVADSGHLIPVTVSTKPKDKHRQEKSKPSWSLDFPGINFKDSADSASSQGTSKHSSSENKSNESSWGLSLSIPGIGSKSSSSSGNTQRSSEKTNEDKKSRGSSLDLSLSIPGIRSKSSSSSGSTHRSSKKNYDYKKSTESSWDLSLSIPGIGSKFSKGSECKSGGQGSGETPHHLSTDEYSTDRNIANILAWKSSSSSSEEDDAIGDYKNSCRGAKNGSEGGGSADVWIEMLKNAVRGVADVVRTVMMGPTIDEVLNDTINYSFLLLEKEETYQDDVIPIVVVNNLEELLEKHCAAGEGEEEHKKKSDCAEMEGDEGEESQEKEQAEDSAEGKQSEVGEELKDHEGTEELVEGTGSEVKYDEETEDSDEENGSEVGQALKDDEGTDAEEESEDSEDVNEEKELEALEGGAVEEKDDESDGDGEKGKGAAGGELAEEIEEIEEGLGGRETKSVLRQLGQETWDQDTYSDDKQMSLAE